MRLTIKDLLKVSTAGMETNKVATAYLDDFKRNQVEKLLDFIEVVEHPPSSISKNKIKLVADELGVAEDYLSKRLKEHNC
jgi:NACalpha-BTF3-like transcription factor